MMIYLGWLVWGVLAYYVAVWVYTKVRHPNGGVRFLAGRCAVVFTIALVATLALGFEKLHLIWLAPVIYMLSMTWNGMILDAHVKRIPSRAELESGRTGEPVDSIIQREFSRWGYEPEDT